MTLGSQYLREAFAGPLWWMRQGRRLGVHWSFDGGELGGWMASMVCFLSSRESNPDD